MGGQNNTDPLNQGPTSRLYNHRADFLSVGINLSLSNQMQREGG